MKAPPRHNDLVAIVLAAGDSTRLATPSPLRLPGGAALIGHTLRAALASGADRAIVVVGPHDGGLLPQSRDLPVQIIEQQDRHSTQSPPLGAALEAASQSAAAVLVLAADHRELSDRLLQTVVRRWRSAPASIVACAHGRTLRAPALFPREFFAELFRLRSDADLTALLIHHRDRVLTVEVPKGTHATEQPRAVIFDFGNVICSFDVGQFIRNLVTATGKPAEELKDAIRSSIPLIRDFESGVVSPEEFIMGMNQAAGTALSPEDFRHAYCEIFTPIPETMHLIRRLKHRYRLGLLSNTNIVHFECAIRPVEVFELFDTVTLSFEVKAMKPARSIYDDALAKLKLRADECVYVDDLQENIEAAAHLGFRAIHYTSHQQLLEDLHRAGVRTDDAQPESGETP